MARVEGKSGQKIGLHYTTGQNVDLLSEVIKQRDVGEIQCNWKSCKLPHPYNSTIILYLLKQIINKIKYGQTFIY